MTSEEFNFKSRRWLLPLGFIEVFKENHPTSFKERCDFVGHGVRVICKFNYGDFEYSIYKDVQPITNIFPSFCLQSYSQAFRYNDDINNTNKLFELIKEINILERRIKREGLFWKIKKLINWIL
jgi:hypothetical protein